MIQWSRHAKTSRSKKTTKPPSTRVDSRVNSGGRTKSKPGCNLSQGKHSAQSVFPLEVEVQGSRYRRVKKFKAGQKTKSRPKNRNARKRTGTNKIGFCRSKHRAAAAEKKRELGLHGPLVGRHLSKPMREALVAEIAAGLSKGETLRALCRALEINPRAYYRWVGGQTSKSHHGGGGGHNKITPLEEKRVVAFAKRNPELRCRRIAYALEQKSSVFIGKTRVSEILKKHGINHTFIQKPKIEKIAPAEMLLHEPWKPNLLWGTDWTYLKIAGKFWYLLLIIDWYSRKIVSFGLFPEITKFQVVAVITEAVAIEGIDKLEPNVLKPRIVADHGSANIAKYTRVNIEVQGLDLWLSGIGRPTGNARTERVMGTLKREEIYLQDEYETENEARIKITAKIHDYNFYRPNQGNGGFAPNAVHHTGRYLLTKRRQEARQMVATKRRKHWTQE